MTSAGARARAAVEVRHLLLHLNLHRHLRGLGLHLRRLLLDRHRALLLRHLELHLLLLLLLIKGQDGLRRLLLELVEVERVKQLLREVREEYDRNAEVVGTKASEHEVDAPKGKIIRVHDLLEDELAPILEPTAAAALLGGLYGECRPRT